MNFKKCLLFLSIFSISFLAKSQTADEVIDRYIRYIGGKKSWEAVKTLTISGTYNYVGVSFPFVSYAKRPDLYKYVVTANGKSFIQAYNGKLGWRIDGFKDEKDKTILKDKQATAMANETEVELETPFLGYRDKGHSVQMEGLDTSFSPAAFKIKLTRKSGETETYYFSTKDFSLVKKKTLSTNDEMDKAPLDVIYSDYKITGGIKMPHKIATSTNGQPVLTIVIERLDINLPIKSSIFNP